MNALLRKKRKWEYHNEQVLLKLVEASMDVTVVSAKKAGQSISFLLFVVYKALEVMLATIRWIAVKPALHFNCASENGPVPVEAPLYSLESKVKNPFFGV